MQTIILLIMIVLLIVFLFVQQLDVKQQKKIWKEFVQGKFVTEMKTFNTEIFYWNNIQDIRNNKKRKKTYYNMNVKKIIASNDIDAIQNGVWRVYIIDYEGRIRKAYIEIKDLIPKQL